MYLVSPAAKDGRHIAALSRKREKESPLVKKRRSTASGFQPETKNAEASSTLAAGDNKVNRLRNREVASCKAQRSIRPHSTWVNLREKLKNADIKRKADIQTIASFLRHVFPINSIAEPGKIKLAGPSSPREKKTFLHVQPGESKTKKTTEFYVTPKRESIFELPEQLPLPPLVMRTKCMMMEKPLARCLRKKT
jgi:hypothetical protein